MHIYISYRWDLAATSLAYIWYFDATSVKKTHSHSPPLSRKGDCESALFALLFTTHSLFCFDICIDWQEEKQMTRLNSLHPSLGAWKTKKKNQKKKTKKKPKTCPQCLQSLDFFLVFFVFCLFRPLWPILAYLGLLWPFDDVKTLQEENTAKHCKENSAKRTSAQRPFLY